MKKIVFILTLIAYQSLLAQSDELAIFKNLAGSTWIAEGKQLGGHQGKTVKEISLGLDGEIVKVLTYTTDPKTLEFGLRNEGVRIFNSSTKTIEFYEFDKLGGVSKGVVIVEGKSLHYEYVYGDLLLRDSWIYQSENEYTYKVCTVSKAGECLAVHHEGIFVRQKK